MSIVIPPLASSAPNLEQQLEEVAEYLKCYKAFCNRVILRMLRFPLQSIYYGYFRKGGYFQRSNQLLTSHRPENQLLLLANLMTGAERNSEFGKALLGSYMVHSISLAVLAKFPCYEYGKLASLHNSREDRFSFTGKEIVASLVAFTSLLLKTVPKEVLDDLGINQTTFVKMVFWAGFAAVCYLLLALIPGWALVMRARWRHRFIASVLNYICLLKQPDCNSAEASQTPPL